MAKLCETSYLKLLGRWNGYFVDQYHKHSDDIAIAKMLRIGASCVFQNYFVKMKMNKFIILIIYTLFMGYSKLIVSWQSYKINLKLFIHKDINIYMYQLSEQCVITQNIFQFTCKETRIFGLYFFWASLGIIGQKIFSVSSKSSTN